jgi:hypothetical protein
MPALVNANNGKIYNATGKSSEPSRRRRGELARSAKSRTSKTCSWSYRLPGTSTCLALFYIELIIVFALSSSFPGDNVGLAGAV